MLLQVECGDHQAILDHPQHETGVSQVEYRLREHRFTGEKRFGNLYGEFDGPGVMLIVAVGKCDEESGIGDSLHGREKPLRAERSLGPRTAPARRRNVLGDPCFIAFSSWSRMI